MRENFDRPRVITNGANLDRHAHDQCRCDAGEWTTGLKQYAEILKNHQGELFLTGKTKTVGFHFLSR